jgi:hypothetical protein
MMQRFGRAWWSVILPEGWRGQHDEECSTMTRIRCEGALQISAYRKEHRPVTDADLREFAFEQRGGSAQLRRYRFGAFGGFGASSRRNGTYWREWWLRAGRVMLYVTFSDEKRARLRSLKPVLDSLAQRVASPNNAAPGRPQRGAASRIRGRASRRGRLSAKR